MLWWFFRSLALNAVWHHKQLHPTGSTPDPGRRPLQLGFGHHLIHRRLQALAGIRTAGTDGKREHHTGDQHGAQKSSHHPTQNFVGEGFHLIAHQERKTLCKTKTHHQSDQDGHPACDGAKTGHDGQKQENHQCPDGPAHAAFIAQHGNASPQNHQQGVKDVKLPSHMS